VVLSVDSGTVVMTVVGDVQAPAVVQATGQVLTVTLSPLVVSVVSLLLTVSATLRLRALASRVPPLDRLSKRLTVSPGARLEMAVVNPAPLSARVSWRMPLPTASAVALLRWRSGRRGHRRR